MNQSLEKSEVISFSTLRDKLPQKYRGKAINLLTDNDPVENDSIVIENINAVYTFGGITDTFFKNTAEVLVLGDQQNWGRANNVYPIRAWVYLLFRKRIEHN